MGFNFYLLDLGGGFSGYKNSSLEKSSEVINQALADFFPGSSIEVIAEPGQFFVASAFTMAVNVHSLKVVEERNHFMYFVNEGIFGGFFDVIAENLKPEPKILNKKYGPLFSSSIWGPTLDSTDQVTTLFMFTKRVFTFPFVPDS